MSLAKFSGPVQGLGSVAILTATGNLALTGDSATWQVIDPGGSGRTVLLPVGSASEAGRMFYIKNTASGNEALTISVNNGAGAALAGGVFTTGNSGTAYASANSALVGENQAGIFVSTGNSGTETGQWMHMGTFTIVP